MDYPCHQRLPIGTLVPYPNNPRTITPEARTQLDKQLIELGNLQPITWNARTGHVISGNQKLEIYAKRGDIAVDVWCVDLAEEKEATAVVALNNHAGEFDLEKLRLIMEGIAQDESLTGLTGFGAGELEKLLASADPATPEGKKNQRQLAHKTLASRFLVPPFSVLDARQGYWQERKAAWIALGLKGELGRGNNLLKMSDTILEPDPEKRAAMKASPLPGGGGTKGAWLHKGPDGYPHNAKSATTEGNIAGDWTGTSIFDPVLAEAIYYWFCPPGGAIIDPFAGGVTRGAVAAICGHPYLGIDLAEAQIRANELLWQTEIKSEAEKIDPQWIIGDSREELPKLMPEIEADLIFSCPPYADLEKYSDNPRDISTMPYLQFKLAYFEIIERALARLKPNRFACFVVSEVRNKSTGFYHNLVADTIDFFQNAGAAYYNELILVTAVGSLPIRVAKHFAKARKIGRTHQNVLVFFKGNPDLIKDEFPLLEAPMEMPSPSEVPPVGVEEMAAA